MRLPPWFPGIRCSFRWHIPGHGIRFESDCGDNVTVDGSNSAAHSKRQAGLFCRWAEWPFWNDWLHGRLGGVIQNHPGELWCDWSRCRRLYLIEQLPSGGSVREGNAFGHERERKYRYRGDGVHQVYTLGNSATVQKVLSPVSGLNVHDLVINGEGRPRMG